MSLAWSRCATTRCRRLGLIVSLSVVGLLAMSGVASAATFTVNSATDTALPSPTATACPSTCSLREAIQAADNTGGASTIVLPAGDYKLTIPDTASGQTDDPAVGDIDVDSGVTLTITGAGASTTTIDANRIDRAFAVHAGAGLSLSGVTLTNGAQPDNASQPSDDSQSPGYGGAVYNDGALSISSSVLSNNSDYDGGGVVYADSAATATAITNSTITGNTNGDEDGGVIDAASGSVTLSADTITNNSTDDYGGVLYDDESGNTVGPVTIANTTMSDNTGGEYGGALYLVDAGATTITDSTVDNNLDYYYGGAIYDDASGPLTITGSTLSNNSSSGEYGGAIYAEDTAQVSILDSVLDDNSSDQGGALYADGDVDLSVSGSSFDGNQAEGAGALYVDGTSGTATESITDSTFSGNQASDDNGGAIDDVYGNLELTGDTFADNQASYYGGALYYVSGDGLEMTNDTLDGNVSVYGGGIFFDKAASTGSISLLNDTITRNSAYYGGGIYYPGYANSIENTIVAGNSGGPSADGGADCYGSASTDSAAAADKGGNIDSDGSCFSDTVSGDQTGVDPLLGTLSDNGGPTETDAPLTGSPAIGTAISAACPNTDQRGVPRPGACDVGAYQTAAADVAVTETGPSSATVGAPVTYTLTVTDGGPAPATGVTLADTLPSGTSYFGSTLSQGSCSGTTTVTCSLGTLNSSNTGTATSVTITITVIPSAPGSITNTATVSASESDPSTANNTASASTTISPLPTTTVTTTTPGPTTTVTTPGPTTTVTGPTVTLGLAPVAATGVASLITSTTARLSAIVNPAAEATTYSIQIGLTKSYGRTIKGGTLKAGQTPREVVVAVKGLKSGRTYHYRIVARNATGVSYGQAMTFTTLKAKKPTVKKKKK